jgi:hypothetical protein
MTRDPFTLPAEVRPALDLAALARRIKAEHAAAGASFQAGLLHARAAGDLLVQAKAQVPHGEWLPWVADNLRCSERTAQAYMRVARRWDELEAKAQGLADLTFEGGLKLLAAPEEWPRPEAAGAEALAEPDGRDTRERVAAYLTELGSPPDPKVIPDDGCCLVFQYQDETLFIEPGGGAYYFVTLLRCFGIDGPGVVEGARRPVLDVAVPYMVRALGAERVVQCGEREQAPAWPPELLYHQMLFMGKEARPRSEEDAADTAAGGAAPAPRPNEETRR